MRIADVLQAKAITSVVTISPDASVRELISAMAEHNIGALIVSADGSSLDGIVSERDVVRHLHHDGTVVNNTVGAIMTSRDGVTVCSPDDPLCEDDDLVGIVSIGDLVKHKIDQLQFERDQLDSYVHQL
jgi:CBS domain-containing protein